MFAFDRSALAVLAPLLLLLAVVLLSNRDGDAVATPDALARADSGPGADADAGRDPADAVRRDQTVAASLPSR